MIIAENRPLVPCWQLKGARDLGGGDLVGEQRARGGKRGGDLLRHHDDESRDSDDHASERVIETLVLSEAIANQSGQDNGRDVEGAQRNCRTPRLKVGKARRIEREQGNTTLLIRTAIPARI